MFEPVMTPENGALFIIAAPAFLALAYIMLRWHAHREQESDDQIGLKVVLALIMLVALGFAAGGLVAVVHYIVSGFKGDTKFLLDGLVTAVVFGGAVAGLWLAIVPRTNLGERPRVSRYVLGYVAGVGAVLALWGLKGFIDVIGPATWQQSAPDLAGLLVYGSLAGFAVLRLGALSGWTAPVRAAAPMGMPGAYPTQPQQAAYPPQQQQPAYPPAGYPQQQPGAYPSAPPQQGGYPPQGGGGGYPPQGGGGGLPPPGGYNR
ncbi:MAG TPA: hypothetical protein VFG83_09605 [Kofleriaceae bacterium]|nr:hypothetical protein [Kofleriaceae bacterium]